MSILSAGTTTQSGLGWTADTTGNLILQTNNTGNAVIINTAQNVTMTNALSVTGNVTAANHVGNVVYPDASVQTSAASPYGMKNRIINGDYRIDQRYNGANVTCTPGGGLNYVADRTFVYTPNGNMIAARVAGTNTGTAYAFRIYGNTSATGFNIGQRIENLNVSDLAGKTVTISATVYSSGAFNSVGMYAYCATSANSGYGSGNNASGTINIAAGLSNVAVTFTMPSTASFGFEAGFGCPTLATGQYVDITNWQLEIGPTATAFERRMITTELQLCQRYFCSTFPLGVAPQQNYSSSQIMLPVSASNYACGWTFPVQMRTAPNITTYNPYNTNASFRVPSSSTDIAVTASGISAVDISYFTCTLTAPSALHANMSANAEL
jgi:hypothetical protein